MLRGVPFARPEDVDVLLSIAPLCTQVYVLEREAAHIRDAGVAAPAKATGHWKARLTPEQNRRVAQDPILASLFDMMEKPKTGRPRPVLKVMAAAMLATIGRRVSPQTIRRHFRRAVGTTFREFLTQALVHALRRGLRKMRPKPLLVLI